MDFLVDFLFVGDRYVVISFAVICQTAAGGQFAGEEKKRLYQLRSQYIESSIFYLNWIMSNLMI